MPAGATLSSSLVLAAGDHAIDVSTWGVLEWACYGSMILVCAWVLWLAVHTTLRPNEDSPDHVKRLILDDEDAALNSRRATAGGPTSRPPLDPSIPSAGTRP